MANEIYLTASLSVFKTTIMAPPGMSMSVDGFNTDMDGNHVVRGSLLVPANIAGTVTGATNANPIQITTLAAHNLNSGDTVTITGVTGNTAANGSFVVTVVDATNFTIAIAGNGSYVSGGSFSTPNGCQIPLGQISSPHYAAFVNRDDTNSVQLLLSQGGSVFGFLEAGGWSFPALDPSMTPWLLANTSSCIVEYMILSL